MPKIKNAALALAIPFIIIAAWEFAVQTGIFPKSLIASPLQVAINFAHLFANGTLLHHALASFARLIPGFAIGSLIGLFFGILVGLSKKAEKILAPTFSFIVPIPPAVWIPVLIILLGIGDASKIGLIALGTALIVYASTLAGIRQTDKKLVELAQVFKKNNFQLVTKILLPSATPQIFAGLRAALCLSWILLIAAEIIAASKGLGWFIWDARNFSRPADMLAGIIAIGILGKATDKALELCQKHLTKWSSTFTGK